MGLKADPVIILQPREKRIASMPVIWKHKAFYISRYSIPQGTLDITDQRMVFTALTGKKEDFNLPLQDISSVRSALLFVDIRTKSRESYLLGTYWKKELMDYLKQAGRRACGRINPGGRPLSGGLVSLIIRKTGEACVKSEKGRYSAGVK